MTTANEKQTDLSKLGSLLDDGALTGSGGFFREGRVICTDAFYVVDQYKKKDGTLFDAQMTFYLFGIPQDPEAEHDPSEPLITHSAGGLDFFRPSNDGITPVTVDLETMWKDLEDDDQQTQQGSTYCPLNQNQEECSDISEVVKHALHAKTNMMEFMLKSIKCTEFRARIVEYTRASALGLQTTSLELFRGLDVEFGSVTKDSKKGQELDNRGERKMLPVVTKVYGVVDVAQKDDGSASKQEVRTRVEAKLQELMLAELTKQGGASEMPAMFGLASMAGDTDAETQAAFEILNDKDWLGDSARPWTFDGSGKGSMKSK